VKKLVCMRERERERERDEKVLLKRIDFIKRKTKGMRVRKGKKETGGEGGRKKGRERERGRTIKILCHEMLKKMKKE